VKPDNMSEQESNRIRRVVALGIIAWIAVIGVSIVLSSILLPTRQELFIIHSSSHFILAG
jgi:hypothetical protein